MPMTTTRRLAAPAFVLFWITAIGAATAIVGSSQFGAHADVLSAALTFDFAITIPGVYLLLAWRFGWRRLTAVPILVLSVIAASLILPADHHRWLRMVEVLLVPLELGLLVFLVIKVRSVRRQCRGAGISSDDFPEVVERVLLDVTGTNRPAKIMATEVAMLYYGFIGWFRGPGPGAGERFTYHRESGHGLVLGVFMLLIVVETAVLHWLLLPRIAWLAWILLALGLYSFVFLFADLNAARLRPVVLEDDELTIRTALRWRVTVPVSSISAIDRETGDIEDREGLLNAVLVGNQNLVLHLDGPVKAQGLYGIEREVDRIALAMDDPDTLVKALDRHST
jgi:hypothetical protein